MTRAEQEIADLDSTLAQDGESVVLRRVVHTTGTVEYDIDVTAFIQAVAMSELTQESTQSDYIVVLSPTEITATGWPYSAVTGGDRRVPRKLDKIVRRSGTLTIQSADPIYMGDTLIRINAKARG